MTGVPGSGGRVADVDPDLAVQLIRRHLLGSGEEITAVRPDGGYVFVQAGRTSFDVEDATERFGLAGVPWVRGLWTVEPGLNIAGGRRLHGFLVPVSGAPVFLEDAAALADLGAHLVDRSEPLDPWVFADLLAQFQPVQATPKIVVDDPERLRARLRGAPLPPLEPPVLDRTPAGGIRFEFTSALLGSAKYGYNGYGLLRWAVAVPPGGPASWTSKAIAEDIPIGLVR
jgi:hypothetical protein